MSKLKTFIFISIFLLFSSLIVTSVTYAQGIDSVIGRVTPPQPVANIGRGAAGISRFLSNLVQLIFYVAAIVFLFMLVIGAFQWVISGGNKESIDSARKRITNAIIGLVIFSLVFLLARIFGLITGFGELFKF